GSEWIAIAEINLNPISEVDTRLSSQLADKASKKQVESKLSEKRDKNVKINKTDYNLSEDINKWNINDFDEKTRKAILEANGVDINYVLGKDSVTRENYS